MPLKLEWPETRYVDKALTLDESEQAQRERLFAELQARLGADGIEYRQECLKSLFHWWGFGRRHMEIVYQPDPKPKVAEPLL
jgi:hypothetical protein